jgi:hypothetical protein
MPLLMTIKTTLAKDDRLPGDVLGVYPDDHLFSDRELKEYTITKISDADALKYRAAFPDIRTAYRAASTDWSVSPPEQKKVWLSATGDWCELKERPYKLVCYTDGKFTERVSSIAANSDTTVISDSISGEGSK